MFLRVIRSRMRMAVGARLVSAMSNPLGPIYSLDFVLLLICAVGYYKAAELENKTPMVWAGMSVGVFLITWRLFRWGIPGNLLGQVLLLAGITLGRVWRDRGTKP